MITGFYYIAVHDVKGLLLHGFSDFYGVPLVILGRFQPS